MSKKTHFLTWVLLKWTKTPICTISREVGTKSVIRKLFDAYNTWTNKFISNLCILLPSGNYLQLQLI